MELQLLLVTFLLSAFAFHFLFRLCFHRHKHYLPPSPRWGLPTIGHMHLLDPLLHHSLHRLSLQYGPLFSPRFGSVPCVVASSLHFAKQFLQTKEFAFNRRIENTATKRLTYECSLAFAPYGDYWRFIKKLSMNQLNNFRHLRAQETRRLLKVLAQKAQACESVNVTEELLKLSNNVISQMMLGEAEETRDVDFFTAGTDTTAISTEWALVELIKNPLLLQQARREIHNVVGKNRIIEESDCANLPYLEAIIKETFRLHPPAAVVSRCVTDCKIENYVIPKNTLLFVNIWSIGRNPNYWNNPLEFRPERFLNFGEGDSSEIIDVRGQHFQLLPFGSGRRMCPGATFAMQLVPALLGAIIQCFDFQLVDSKGMVLKGDKVVIDVGERPGLTAPRAHDLVCVPVERSSFKQFEILG